MSLAKINTRAEEGLQAPKVKVEVHLSNGLPSFSIVGLPETAVKESRERVRSALINSNFNFHNRRITVSLAPANLPKSGGRYDLPIALGILIASKQIKVNIDIDNYEFYGELGLDGTLRDVGGLLPAAINATKNKKLLVMPKKDAEQVALVKDVNVYGLKHLINVYELIQGEEKPQIIAKLKDLAPNYDKDLNEVKGQYNGKRALEIAAAGGHNLLFIGAPGAGKTMLAERMPTILPNLSEDESLEKAAIFSVAGMYVDINKFYQRPFRSPHHTSSSVALVGGGTYPKPGEISLAHNGVLFLDEFVEFPRNVLEVLRQPLENGIIHISRAAKQTTYPADFQLIAAMNPCPCGHYGSSSGKCNCSEDKIYRYRSKISGPILDRIDMLLEIQPLDKKTLLDNTNDNNESSVSIKKRVIKAYKAQINRQNKLNYKLTSKEVSKNNYLNSESKEILEKAIIQLKLSARSYYRILKVARTIADLALSQNIEKQHIIEAISYRRVKFE